MPKIEKDLLKVKGSDGQWHYVPAVGGSVDTAPTWDEVQNKPFYTLGGGLSVDKNGVLSAEGGGGSANAVQYVAQTLTDEQKKQARSNIGASPIPTVRYWLNLKADNIINLYNMGVGYGIISPGDYDQTVPTGMSSPMLVIFGRMNYGRVDITVYDGAGAVWSGSLNLSSQTTDVTKTGDYVTNTALTDILHNYVPAENYEENLQEIAQAIGTKLDKNQGTGNAGKILGIGADGNVIPQDKPTYTLPQATADALGGIKADAATAEDTQDVRMGTDGKLRTKPTGGSSVTVDSELSSTSVNPVQNKVVTAALAEKITAPTTAAVGQIIKVKSVDTSGKPTEWEAADLPSGGTEKEWTKILEVEVTEATAAFEVTGLDNYTEFLAINSGLQNATSTDSAQNLYINGIQVCVSFVDVPKSGGLAYNYAIAKYNGMVWECHKAGKAISATNLAPSTAYIPYNVVLGVGKATSIKTATANTTYVPVSGKITIYGR